MGQESFSLWDEVVIDTTGLTIVANEPVVLASSGQIENGPTARTSLLVELNYEDITPDVTDGAPSFTIGAIVEVQDVDGHWSPIMYQFSPVRNSEDPAKRIMRMQPNISDFNTGIDDSVYPVDREIARISRQQGFLPDGKDFRVCLLLVEKDPGGPNSFQSVKMSATGTRYDHA